ALPPHRAPPGCCCRGAGGGGGGARLRATGLAPLPGVARARPWQRGGGSASRGSGAPPGLSSLARGNAHRHPRWRGGPLEGVRAATPEAGAATVLARGLPERGQRALAPLGQVLLRGALPLGEGPAPVFRFGYF